MRPVSVQCSLLVLTYWRLDAPVSLGPAHPLPSAAGLWPGSQNLTLWALSLVVSQGLKGTPECISGALSLRNSLMWGLCPVSSSHLGLQHPFPNSCLLFIEFCFFPCMLPSHPGAPIVEIWELYSMPNFALQLCIFTESFSLCFSLDVPCWLGFHIHSFALWNLQLRSAVTLTQQILYFS